MTSSTLMTSSKEEGREEVEEPLESVEQASSENYVDVALSPP